MTTISTRTYKINDNFSLFIEKYCHESFKAVFWRYGLINNDKGYSQVFATLLSSRPNAKRCIKRLAGMIY